MKPNTRASRWHLKKATRALAVLGRWGSGSLLLSDRLQRPRLRALTYHRFGHATHDPFCVPRRDFEAQMAWLAEHGLAVSLNDAVAFVRGERTLGHGSVLVTIDDGSRSVFSEALPILKSYGIPAVVYVVSDLVGEGPTALPERFMSWNELEQLVDAGIEIGSHTCTHRSMTSLTDEECAHEALASRRELQSRLGISVSSFAYPYGTPVHYDRATEGALAAAGYSSAFVSTHGSLGPGAPLLRLPRIKVESGESLWMFEQLCRGGMDTWGLVDRALALPQYAQRHEFSLARRFRFRPEAP